MTCSYLRFYEQMMNNELHWENFVLMPLAKCMFLYQESSKWHHFISTGDLSKKRISRTFNSGQLGTRICKGCTLQR